LPQALLCKFEGLDLPPHMQMTWGKSPCADRLSDVADLPRFFCELRSKEQSVPPKKLELVVLIKKCLL